MEVDHDQSNHTFWHWIKHRILFKVPKEQKKYVKENIMKSEHAFFRRMLIAVFILQFIMIMYTLIATGFKPEGKKVGYLICYCCLGASTVVFYLISEYLQQKNKYNKYFAVVTIAINLFFIWACAITVLDCFNGTDLTTFSYVCLAITSLVILEPWIFIVDTVGYVVALNLILVFVPEIKYYPSVVISSISIAVLTMIIAIINFNRRINSLYLEKEIIDLNTILKERAYYDDLTHVHNRRYLTEHIDNPINIGSSPSAVLMFDIDDFKMINDKYGHQNGDLCLIEIGNLINKFIQKFKNSYAVRYGGEEFLIFIPHAKEETIQGIAEEFRKEVEQADIMTLENDSLHITISLGVALAKSGMNYSALINKADANAYIAKNNGKNQVCLK